ncbi:MAG TPA: hypothetical protein VM619_16265 [Luteimonas sp.]|nr:hypothetical protein [Luteimonas sp.]
MSIRTLLCLLLLCASFQLMAREVRMASADGDGGGTCQDDAMARDGDAVAAAAPAAKPARHVVKPVKAKPPVAGRGGGGDNLGDIRPPRWHSFLPGMFR